MASAAALRRLRRVPPAGQDIRREGAPLAAMEGAVAAGQVDCDALHPAVRRAAEAGTGKVCNAVKAASAAASGTTLRGRGGTAGQ